MPRQTGAQTNVWEIFLIFLRLGLTSFGGPIAHIGFFRDEFVSRRKWMTERSYADLVALCQFLPGPASSQVGLAVGLSRAGYRGAAAAWLGFTMPSAIALMLVAMGVTVYDDVLSQGLLTGLKIAAVAVVAQAVWGMARSLCPDTARITLMAVAATLAVLSTGAFTQILIIVAAGLAGLLYFKRGPDNSGPNKGSPDMVEHDPWQVNVSRRAGLFWLLLFFVLLAGLPLLASMYPSQSMQMIDAFYRSGSLVFGGGHVVLPLLQAEVVPTGWVDEHTFLAGYGVAQAVPGPLFTFAAFLGAAMNQAPTAWAGGLLCLGAIFAPSFLLIAGALPFWQELRQNKPMQAALMGVNAGVVGLLVAALYNPVWVSAIQAPQHFGLALLAFVALMFWRAPSWLVVIGCALAGVLSAWVLS